MIELSERARTACTQAVRWRMTELDGERDEGARRRARRDSLTLLQFALEGEWRLDRLQMQHLRQLLSERAEYLRDRPLPFWGGAQYLFLVDQLNELRGGEEATAAIDRLLAEPR